MPPAFPCLCAKGRFILYLYCPYKLLFTTTYAFVKTIMLFCILRTYTIIACLFWQISIYTSLRRYSLSVIKRGEITKFLLKTLCSLKNNYRLCVRFFWDEVFIGALLLWFQCMSNRRNILTSFYLSKLFARHRIPFCAIHWRLKKYDFMCGIINPHTEQIVRSNLYIYPQTKAKCSLSDNQDKCVIFFTPICQILSHISILPKHCCGVRE